MRRPSLLIAIIAILLIAGGSYYLFFQKKAGPGGPGGPGGFAMPVEAIKVAGEPFDVTVRTVGSLNANESVVIKPEVAGRIDKIHFTEGTAVKKGAMLFTIDDRLAEAEYKQMLAQLALAQVKYDRMNKLIASGAVSQTQLDEGRATLRVAEADASLTKTRLDKTRITAPFDGIVGLRSVSPGDYVTIGQDLANFEGYDPMKVDFNIPERAASLVQEGQTIDVVVDAIPDQTFKGKVYAINSMVDANGRNIAIRAMLPNPDRVLKPGYFARIDLMVEKKDNAMFVPESAIMPQGTDSYVFVVGLEDKVVRKQVKIDARKEGQVEVTEGLSNGDVVVTAGQIKLQEGAQVAPQFPKTAEVAPAAGALEEKK